MQGRCFSKANYAAIAQRLSTCQWDVLFSNCRSVNEYWTVLLRLLQKLISEFVPLVTKRATATACVKPRLPKHVRKLILIKRKALRRWKASPALLTRTLTTAHHAPADWVYIGILQLTRTIFLLPALVVFTRTSLAS
jgi:hypothetical protein